MSDISIMHGFLCTHMLPCAKSPSPNMGVTYYGLLGGSESDSDWPTPNNHTYFHLNYYAQIMMLDIKFWVISFLTIFMWNVGL